MTAPLLWEERLAEKVVQVEVPEPDFTEIEPLPFLAPLHHLLKDDELENVDE